MKYPLLSARLYGAPLLIHPEKAAIIETVFRTRGVEHVINVEEPTRPRRDMAMSTVKYRMGADKPYALTEGGVAVIEVLGTLVQRGDWMDAMSGITSYGRIESQLASAIADPDVKAILLEVDSPGGEANGCFDLCDQIRGAGESKPVWAIANEQAYSGGYAIAGSAQKLYMPRTAGVGSIGVIALHIDQSKRDAAQGYAYTYLFAGERKADGNPHEPLSDPARKALQGEINRIYDIFTQAVADGRGIDVEVVRATQAGLLSPDQAVEQGFADGIATFAETVSMLEAEVSGGNTSFSNGTRLAASLSVQPSKGDLMTEPTKPATTPAAQPAAAQVDASAITTSATTAERSRIAAILNCEEAKGRTKLAQHLAMETDTSPEQAKKLLAVAAVENAAPVNQLAAAMADVKNPEVGAAGAAAAAGGGDETADAVARRIASYGQPAARQ